MSVYSLSFHANYACRNSGACCTAGWSIPVEPRLLPLLGVELLVPDGHGRCAHFDRESRLCDVQRDHGEHMLPGSCYQFPRRALIDDRGTFITLSNFCPTAATLLCASDAPLTIVRAPAAFPERRAYEGLDARGHWPPLVRPGLLFDLESYSKWDAFIVDVFAGAAPVDDALARIAGAAEILRTWKPSLGPFEAWVVNTLEQAPADFAALNRYRHFRGLEAHETLRRFVPLGLTAPPPAPSSEKIDANRSYLQAPPVRRYLASKAFGSWSAYEGRGVRTLVAELVVSESVLRVECERTSRDQSLDQSAMIDAIRQSDLFLVHLIDRPRMLEWLGTIEGA